MPGDKVSKIPDPGKYYADEIDRKCKILKEAGLRQKVVEEKGRMVKSLQENVHMKQNFPSIPAKNEQFGYTFMECQSNKPIRNFNPNIMEGTKEDCGGPGEYDPIPMAMQKNIGSPKMYQTGSLVKAKKKEKADGVPSNFVGPGSYDPHYMIPNYKFKPSANFVYAGNRSLLDNELRKKEV